MRDSTRVSSNTEPSFFSQDKNNEGKYIIIENEENTFDVNSIHPFVLQKFLESNFSGYTDLRKLNAGKVMLKTRTNAQADKYLGKELELYE